MHHFLRIAMNFSQYFECIQELDFGGLYIVCSELALALDRPLAELIALSKRTRLKVGSQGQTYATLRSFVR